MFHISTFCPFDSTASFPAGVVGFWRCSDGTTLVLMCDECNAVWLDPTSVTSESALFPSSPDFIVDSLGISLRAPKTGWAEREEITTAGWEGFIAGESHAL